MKTIGFYIKSGISGHFDYDSCDLRIALVRSESIPMIGEVITFTHDNQDERNGKKYLVCEVVYNYSLSELDKTDIHDATQTDIVDVYVRNY